MRPSNTASLTAEATLTDRARKLLACGLSPPEVARILPLHEAYVRKIRLRDNNRDPHWAAWRRDNPDKVAAYRAKQNRDRLEARRARRVAPATDDRSKTGHRQLSVAESGEPK